MNRYIHYLYLLFALVGLGASYYVGTGIMAHNGSFSVSEFATSTWTTDYAKSITVDFWALALAATTFIIVEGRRLDIKWWWLYIILTFTVAVGFAFPLFLFMRHKALLKRGLA